MRPHRPFLVGLVCWILILSGAYVGYKQMLQISSAGFQAALEIYPYPAAIAETILFGSLALAVICGILIYEGQAWARYVYLPGAIPFLVQRYLWTDSLPVTTPHHNLHWLIYGAEVAFYLFSAVVFFLPAARRYFHPPLYLDE